MEGIFFSNSERVTQGCKLAPVIGHLSGKFEVLTGKLRSLIGHPDGLICEDGNFTQESQFKYIAVMDNG